MAYDITLVVDSVLDDSSKATIKDTTTYSSPARNLYSSVFYAYKVDEDEVTSALAVTSQGVVTTVDEWEVTTPADGYHRFLLLLYWDWDATTNFVTGDVVHYTDGLYYKALQNNDNQVPTGLSPNWVLFSASAADVDEQLVETGTLNCILFGRIKGCFASEVAAAGDIACLCADDKKPSQIQRYERLGVLVDAIAVDNYQQRFGEGEKKVIYTTSICSDL